MAAYKSMQTPPQDEDETRTGEAAPAADSHPADEPQPSDVRMGAACAAAGAGLLFTGNPVVAVGLGAAAAYATTRDGKMGSFSRRAGEQTVASYRKAKAWWTQNDVSAQVRDRVRHLDTDITLKERFEVARQDISRKFSACVHMFDGGAAARASHAARTGGPSRHGDAAPGPGPGAGEERPVIRGVPLAAKDS